MVSLIITAHNYDRYVERAIRSGIDQSIAKDQYEIIVVNDASTDRTSEILENYSDVARCFNLEENVGLSAARNFGIQKARGQFVMFLDADDYVHKDILKVTKLFLDENNALDSVSVDYWLVDQRGNRIRQVDASKEPIACGILFRKDFLFDVGLYDEAFVAREEEDLRLRWEKVYGVHNLSIPLYRYRMHELNLTKDGTKMKEGQEQLMDKHNSIK